MEVDFALGQGINTLPPCNNKYFLVLTSCLKTFQMGIESLFSLIEAFKVPKDKKLREDPHEKLVD